MGRNWSINLGILRVKVENRHFMFFVLFFLAMLALWFAAMSAVTWVLVAVLAGFGFTVPYWPTFGALFLLQLVFGGMSK